MPDPTSIPLLRDPLARALHATRDAGYTRWGPDRSRADAILAAMRADPELLLFFVDAFRDSANPNGTWDGVRMADRLFGKPE